MCVSLEVLVLQYYYRNLLLFIVFFTILPGSSKHAWQFHCTTTPSDSTVTHITYYLPLLLLFLPFLLCFLPFLLCFLLFLLFLPFLCFLPFLPFLLFLDESDGGGLVGASVILRGLVGELVGASEGAFVGTFVGAFVGAFVGKSVGSADGLVVVLADGLKDPVSITILEFESRYPEVASWESRHTSSWLLSIAD